MSFASKNSIFKSALDGAGIGIGFTISLTLLGTVREFLGSASVFGYKIEALQPYGMLVFVLAPGAFIALGYLMVLFNKATAKIR